MSTDASALRVTALAVSAQLGGTERVLLDFAARAFEFDVALQVVTPRQGPLQHILSELGIPTHVVPAPRALLRGSQRLGALWTVPQALAGLRAWARDVRRHPAVGTADVVYSVAFKTHLAAGRRAGGPAVAWHLHEFPPAGTGGIWKRLAVRVPDATIANSRAVAAAWTRRRSPPPAVVPNGVDLDRFRPRGRTYAIHDQLGIPRDDRLIGMPAVLARWKGQLAVLDAFADVAEELPEVHLVLLGGNIYDTAAEDRYEQELRDAIQRRRAGGLDRVHLLPFQRKVEFVYPELDLAVHYSTRPEAFGRVILEAMACATPVLAAAEGGPREILTEGGWLVEPRRPTALAAKLMAALRLPPASLRQVGAQGRVRAEDRYSARRFAREIAEVLKGVKHRAGA